MAGRHAKPIELILYDGKKHLGKQEIEDRKAAEIRIGTQDFSPPTYVRSDPAAYKRWREVMRIVKCDEAKDLVTNADTGTIARYCCTYSEYLSLVEIRKQVADLPGFSSGEQKEIEEEFEANRGARQASRMWAKVEYIFSVNGIMDVDRAINAKLTALLQYECQMFLTPLARIKTVGRKKEEQRKDPLEQAGFGNI